MCGGGKRPVVWEHLNFYRCCARFSLRVSLPRNLQNTPALRHF